MLERLFFLTARVLAVIAGTALLVMMVLTFVDVIGRYGFHRSIFGTAEIVEYLMIFTIFAGLAFVTATNDHITVTMFDGWIERWAPELAALGRHSVLDRLLCASSPGTCWCMATICGRAASGRRCSTCRCGSCRAQAVRSRRWGSSSSCSRPPGAADTLSGSGPGCLRSDRAGPRTTRDPMTLALIGFAVLLASVVHGLPARVHDLGCRCSWALHTRADGIGTPPSR